MIKFIDFAKIYKKKIPQLKRIFGKFIINGEYIGGRFVKEFEDKIKKIINAKYVIACKSGTHALQLALIAAGIKNGDEVITVGNTYYATVYAIKSIGAKPIFCDILINNGLMDETKIEDKITNKTKAILPVHLYGIPVNLKKIRNICKKHKLILIEDCAHAFGSKYCGKYIGSDSDFACFSLYPTKNLGAFGDGGMVITKSKKNEMRIRRVIYLTNKKRNKFNSRAIHAMLDPIQAILTSLILNDFLKNKKHRQKIAKIYRKELKNYVRIIPDNKICDVNPYVFPIFLNNRNHFINYMKSNSIELQIHYNINLHHLNLFGGLPVGSLPITEKHNKEVVSLSVHPSFSMSNAKIVCNLIKKYVNQKK
jgi:dTDP-4-amino-4,6-dideoxygalactose transaminase